MPYVITAARHSAKVLYMYLSSYLTQLPRICTGSSLSTPPCPGAASPPHQQLSSSRKRAELHERVDFTSATPLQASIPT